MKVKAAAVKVVVRMELAATVEAKAAVKET